MNKNAPLMALLAAAAFGISTPLAKLLLGNISPWALASLLYLGSGFGLGIIALFRKKDGSSEARLSRRSSCAGRQTTGARNFAVGFA